MTSLIYLAMKPAKTPQVIPPAVCLVADRNTAQMMIDNWIKLDPYWIWNSPWKIYNDQNDFFLAGRQAQTIIHDGMIETYWVWGLPIYSKEHVQDYLEGWGINPTAQSRGD